MDCEERVLALEGSIEKMSIHIVDIRTKIYNGFSHSIKNTEDKVNYIDEANKKEHTSISYDVKELSKKMDKLLWKLVGITFFAIIASYLIKSPGGFK